MAGGGDDGDPRAAAGDSGDSCGGGVEKGASGDGGGGKNGCGPYNNARSMGFGACDLQNNARPVGFGGFHMRQTPLTPRIILEVASAKPHFLYFIHIKFLSYILKPK